MNTARDDQHDEPVEFIRLPKVKELTGLGTTKLYEMANKGLFPKQVPVGGRAVAWVKAEVLQWNIDQLTAARGERDQDSASSPSR